jgi:hypothetical protein
MEYSVEVYQSKVKTVITNHDIYIEVVEEITNNRLQWSYLKAESLYIIQTIYALICEFPSKFAAAIQISRLKKKKERGFHVLFATSTMLEGLIANENITVTDISVKVLKEEFDVILYMFKKRISFNVICNQINVFLIKLQPTKLACHIFLNFAYGELVTIQTTCKNKLCSEINTELWTSFFFLFPCTNLYEIFQKAVTTNLLLQSS